MKMGEEMEMEDRWGKEVETDEKSTNQRKEEWRDEEGWMILTKRQNGEVKK